MTIRPQASEPTPFDHSPTSPGPNIRTHGFATGAWTGNGGAGSKWERWIPRGITQGQPGSQGSVPFEEPTPTLGMAMFQLRVAWSVPAPQASNVGYSHPVSIAPTYFANQDNSAESGIATLPHRAAPSTHRPPGVPDQR